MKERGIQFRTGVNVGKDITAAELLKQFHRYFVVVLQTLKIYQSQGDVSGTHFQWIF